MTRKRVPLVSLSAANIESDAIADPVVREAVRAAWRARGGGDPKKAFAEPASHPHLRARDGRLIPIHRVRLNVSDKPRPIGAGARRRFVVSGKDSLHHTVLVAEQTRRGERWRDEPVDRMEVHRRRAAEAKPEVIQTGWPAGRFVIALCKNDCVEMDDGAGSRAIYVIRSISKGDITIRLHHDARKDDQIKEAGDRSKFRIRSADEFRKRGACRVVVDPLGKVQRVGIGRV